MKKIYVLCLVLLCCIFLPSVLTAQEATTQIIKGQVSQIAEDGSSITVNGIMILTESDFIKDYMIESGDMVEITAEQGADGLVATECSYLVDEESADVSSDE